MASLPSSAANGIAVTPTAAAVQGTCQSSWTAIPTGVANLASAIAYISNTATAVEAVEIASGATRWNTGRIQLAVGLTPQGVIGLDQRRGNGTSRLVLIPPDGRDTSIVTSESIALEQNLVRDVITGVVPLYTQASERAIAISWTPRTAPTGIKTSRADTNVESGRRILQIDPSTLAVAATIDTKRGFDARQDSISTGGIRYRRGGTWTTEEWPAGDQLVSLRERASGSARTIQLVSRPTAAEPPRRTIDLRVSPTEVLVTIDGCAVLARTSIDTAKAGSVTNSEWAVFSVPDGRRLGRVRIDGTVHEVAVVDGVVVALTRAPDARASQQSSGLSLVATRLGGNAPSWTRQINDPQRASRFALPP